MNINICVFRDEVLQPTVTSKQISNESKPYWEQIKGTIEFRGTLDELEDNFLQISYYKSLFETPIRIWVTLRGVSLSGYLKAQFKTQIKPSKDQEDDEQQGLLEQKNTEYGGQKEVLKIEQQKQQDDEEECDMDMDLEKDKVLSTLEGRVVLNDLPRFKQKGEMVKFRQNARYLCVQIFRCEHILSPDDRGIIDSFVTVQWGGTFFQTQVFYDSSNPQFDEKFVFKIPIQKERFLNDPVYLKQELENRNAIFFNLWLTDESYTNLNIGYIKFHFTELHDQPLDYASETDYFTKRKLNCKTRTASLCKGFTSAMFNASDISMYFAVYFFPDLPQELDVSKISTASLDLYPNEIEQQMNEHEYEGMKRKIETMNMETIKKNEWMLNWQDKNTNSFPHKSIDKSLLSIIMKYIYVKDQYGKFHFIPKYLDKFSIQESKLSSVEWDKLTPAQQNQFNYENSLKTRCELAQFVRAIPFTQINDQNDSIIVSPEFMLLQKTGTILDHAIFLACIFLAHSDDDDATLVKSPLENRVFVCIGTKKSVLSRKNNLYSWVLTFDETFSEMTFWDPFDSHSYTLSGRTSPKELQEYFGIKTEAKGGMKFNALFGKSKNMLKKKNEPTKKNLVAEQEQQQKAGNQKNGEEEEIEFIWKDLQDVPEMLTGYCQIIEKIDEPLINMDALHPNLQIKTTGIPKGSNTLFKEKEKKQMHTEPPKSQFIQAQCKQEQEEEDKNDLKIRFKRQIDEKLVAPYKSLELLISQKNIYVNLQNQHPEFIRYNLYDRKQWRTFIPIEQKQVLGSFYQMRNLAEPITKDEAAKLLDSLFRDVQVCITNKRSTLGLTTKWKQNENEKTIRKIKELLNLINDYERGQHTKEEFDQIKQEWEIEFKLLLPTNFAVKLWPMRFNILELERIRSIIVENTFKVYEANSKVTILTIAGIINSYPGKIAFMRLCLAVYTKDDNIEEDEEKDEEEDEDGSDDEEDDKDYGQFLDPEDNNQVQVMIE